MKELAERYEGQPLLRALVQLIPGGFGAAFDSALSTRLANMRQERARIFLDALARRGVDLNEELLESDDFIHCFVRTIGIAVNSRRDEKVNYLAQLLSGAFTSKKLRDVDEYEEFLSVLDELSFREIEVLSALDDHIEGNRPSFDSKSAQEMKRYWVECLDYLSSAVDIPRSEITPVLRRLLRSGFLDRVRVSSSEREISRVTLGTISVVLDDELVVPSQRYHRLKAIVHQKRNA